MARLNHPGIVTLHDFGQTKEYYYFIMEFVDGINLRQLIQAKTLEPRQALELVTQICTALKFAHDEKIVHRDISRRIFSSQRRASENCRFRASQTARRPTGHVVDGEPDR